MIEAKITFTYELEIRGTRRMKHSPYFGIVEYNKFGTNYIYVLLQPFPQLTWVCYSKL